MYLLWGALNVWLLLYFLLTCFRSVKLVREHLGGLAVVVLVFGSLSFISSDDEPSAVTENKANDFALRFRYADSLPVVTHDSREIILSETLLAKKKLRVRYEKDMKGRIVSVSGWSSYEGFYLWTEWQPGEALLNQMDDASWFTYTVHASEDWKLLGVRVFNDVETYEGQVQIP